MNVSFLLTYSRADIVHVVESKHRLNKKQVAFYDGTEMEKCYSSCSVERQVKPWDAANK